MNLPVGQFFQVSHKKENKLNYYRRKGCIEKICKKLKVCAVKTIDYEEKEMIPLTKEKKKSYKKAREMSYMRTKVLCG